MRNRILCVIVFFLFFCLILSIAGRMRYIQIGAWTQGFWDKSTNKIKIAKLSEFEMLIGRKVDIAHLYLGWEYLDKPEVIALLQESDRQDWTLLLSINPYFFNECEYSDLPLYRAIAEGACDNFLKSIKATLAKYNKPFFLRFAWEMNIKPNEWSLFYTRSTPSDFIKAWRHIHDHISSKSESNIKWVFCPNVLNGNATDFEKMYPGDEYVDWTCLDGYNWGTTQSWSKWQSFDQIYDESYQRLVKIAPDKPMMIGEVNAASEGGDKSVWFRDMLLWQIPFRYPNIQAVVLYNENRSLQEGVDWTIKYGDNGQKTLKWILRLPFYW